MASNVSEKDIRFHVKSTRGLNLNKRNTALSSYMLPCTVNTDQPMVPGETLDVMIENEGKVIVLFLNNTDSKVLAEVAVESYNSTQVLQICFDGMCIHIKELIRQTFAKDIDVHDVEQIRIGFQIMNDKIRITLLNGNHCLFKGKLQKQLHSIKN